jgi:hypothetical protein
MAARAMAQRVSDAERARLRVVAARVAWERAEAAHARARVDYDAGWRERGRRSQLTETEGSWRSVLNAVHASHNALDDAQTEFKDAQLAFARARGLTDVESHASSTCRDCVARILEPRESLQRLTIRKLDTSYAEQCHVCRTEAINARRPRVLLERNRHALRLFECYRCDGATCSNCLEPMPAEGEEAGGGDGRARPPRQRRRRSRSPRGGDRVGAAAEDRSSSPVSRRAQRVGPPAWSSGSGESSPEYRRTTPEFSDDSDEGVAAGGGAADERRAVARRARRAKREATIKPYDDKQTPPLTAEAARALRDLIENGMDPEAAIGLLQISAEAQKKCAVCLELLPLDQFHMSKYCACRVVCKTCWAQMLQRGIRRCPACRAETSGEESSKRLQLRF